MTLVDMSLSRLRGRSEFLAQLVGRVEVDLLTAAVNGKTDEVERLEAREQRLLLRWAKVEQAIDYKEAAIEREVTA